MADLFNLTFDDADLSQCDDAKADYADLHATATAALGGSSAGLKLELDGAGEAWVKVDFTLSTDDFRYRVYLNTTSLTMADTDAIYLIDVQDSSTTRQRLILQYDTDHFELVADINDDGGTPATTSDITITNAEHYVEVYYERATSDVAGDGALEIWVDGSSEGTIASIDNYDVFRNMQAAYLGAIGVDSGTSGTLKLDEFRANNDGSEIGGELGGEPGSGSVIIAATRTALSTSTGTQDLTTTDCESETPVAALQFLTNATADATAANHATFTVGAATGSSNRWSQASASEHNQADTDTYNWAVTDQCLLKQFGTGALDGEADYSALITNGLRINIGNAFNAAYLLNSVFFCGSAVSAYAGTFTPHGTQDNYTDVTSPGFEPDVVLLFEMGRGYDDTKYDVLYDSWGVAVNDGSETQRCALWHSEDAQASAEVHGYFSETRCGGQLATGGGSLIYMLEVDSFLSNGFRVYTRDGAPSGTDSVGYLALAFAGAAQVWAGTVTTPASTGSDSVTGVGFTPQFVLEALTHMPAAATHYATAAAGSRGFSILTENTQYCVSVQDEDGADPTDTQSFSDDAAVNLPQDDGSAGHVASHTSFDADGWTRNYTTNAVGAVKGWALAIGEASSAGGERGTGRGIMRHVMRGV